MQTVPVFAYLVPILWFFGFNPVAAMIATIVYAMPPMVRNTVLALQRVPAEVDGFRPDGRLHAPPDDVEGADPLGAPGLMVGVNQVIMLSLNMVIIASMIGAGGLGHEVLAALRRLDFGAGLEAAVAITLLAIALDRLSPGVRAPAAAGARRGGAELRCGAIRIWWQRSPLLLGGWLLAALWPAIAIYPESLQITTGDAVNAAMAWVNIHLFDTIEAIKAWLLINLMVPLKRLLLGLPWPAVVAAVALAGWQLGGWRLAAADRRLRAVHRAHRQLAERDGDRLPVRPLGADRLPDRHPDRRAGRRATSASTGSRRSWSTPCRPCPPSPI